MHKTLTCFLLALASLSANTTPPPSLTENANLHFALQVNSSPENYTTLTIQLPENYKALQNPELWAASSVLEFVPNNESANNWTHNITITKYLGKKLDAAEVITMIKSSLLSTIQNPQSWEENELKKEGYKKASFGLSYDRNAGHEITKVVYYSGPVDCIGVQYTIRSSSSTGDPADIAEINKFFENNVILTTSP